MYIRLASVILAATLLVGCASAPPAKNVIANPAAGHPVPLAAVALDDNALLLGALPIKGAFGPDVPAVKLDRGNDSYYHLYRLAPRTDVLRLRVTSYCACFGFDKRVAVPVVRVLSKSGRVIEPVPDGYVYEVEGPHGFTPLSVTLDVTVHSAEAAYALVASDNSNPGALVSRIDVAGLMQLGITTSPVGRFDVRELAQ